MMRAKRPGTARGRHPQPVSTGEGSVAETAASAAATSWSRFKALPWTLWTRQVLAIARLDLKKNFFTRRGFWIYLLALAPVLVIGGHAIEVLSRGYSYQEVYRVGNQIVRENRGCSLSQDTTILAGIFQFYYLRLGIFFGCMGIFTWLIRGEVVERSLHYYFLAPVRRELLVIGKFAAGVVTAFVIFGSGVFLSFFLMYFHFGPIGQQFVFDGPGLSHLASYLLVTALACFGYGSVFLALSLVLRNPIIPGVILLGWETISGVLPALLQKLSVTFYLKHLSPVQVPGEGLMALFTVMVEPVPRWLAVLGLLCLSAVVLAYACIRIRRFEISYSTD